MRSFSIFFVSFNSRSTCSLNLLNSWISGRDITSSFNAWSSLRYSSSDNKYIKRCSNSCLIYPTDSIVFKKINLIIWFLISSVNLFFASSIFMLNLVLFSSRVGSSVIVCPFTSTFAFILLSNQLSLIFSQNCFLCFFN